MRLFIGIKISSENLLNWPEAYRKLKVAFSKKEFEVRWTPPSDYHITLAFLGETEESRIPELQSIIERIATEHAPIETKAEGLDAFPGIHSGRVIWIGIHNKKTLRALQENLVALLLQHHFQPPAEGFVPHVTIARLRNLHSVKSCIDPFLRRSWGPLTIDELTLYKSEVFGPYPKYTPLFTQPLSGHPSPNPEE
jgi:2'-5' RNA ligase